MTTHPTDGYTDKLQQVRYWLYRASNHWQAEVGQNAEYCLREALKFLDELQAQREAAPDVVEAVYRAIPYIESAIICAWPAQKLDDFNWLVSLKAALNAMGDARKGEERHATEPSDSVNYSPSQLGGGRNIESPAKTSWTCPDCCVNPCDCRIMGDARKGAIERASPEGADSSAATPSLTKCPRCYCAIEIDNGTIAHLAAPPGHPDYKCIMQGRKPSSPANDITPGPDAYGCYPEIARGYPQKCPACNGNDADMPCAYPREHEKQKGCLRNARLQRREISVNSPVADDAIFLNENSPRSAMLNALCDGYNLIHPLIPEEGLANRWRMANALSKLAEGHIIQAGSIEPVLSKEYQYCSGSVCGRQFEVTSDTGFYCKECQASLKGNRHVD